MVVQSTGREPIEGPAALATLEGVRELVVAKGRKVERFDLDEARPSDDDLLALMLGRSGKLRAPTLRTGDVLLVGYHADTLAELFG